MNISSLKKIFGDYLMDSYRDYPHSNYISLVLIRKTEAEAILRTDEGLNEEFTFAGMKDSSKIMRVVFSKRKQVAVERRSGRELLRKLNLLKTNSNNEICELNMNKPCGKCLDCMVYGYAVGDGGAQKSRVLYENAYSLLPSKYVTSEKTFNAIYENGTMRKPGTNEASSSINTNKYIVPEAIFIDVVTFRDLTETEFIYAFGNVLRSSRYGAISSRIGKFSNYIVSLVCSNHELFSSLELTKALYDKIKNDEEELKENPHINTAITSLKEIVKKFASNKSIGNYNILNDEELISLISFIKEKYKNSDELKQMFEKQTSAYSQNNQ